MTKPPSSTHGDSQHTSSALQRLLLPLSAYVRFAKLLEAALAHLLFETGRIKNTQIVTYGNIAIAFYRGK